MYKAWQIAFLLCFKRSDCKNTVASYNVSKTIIFPIAKLTQVTLKVYEESDSYGDILLENFQESYLNLTVKSLMIVKFAALTTIRSEFTFKVRKKA